MNAVSDMQFAEEYKCAPGKYYVIGWFELFLKLIGGLYGAISIVLVPVLEGGASLDAFRYVCWVLFGVMLFMGMRCTGRF